MRSHCRVARVDSVQVELPMSIRSQPGVMRDTAILALAAGIKKFHSLHYDHTSRRDCSDRHVVNGTHSSKTSCSFI